MNLLSDIYIKTVWEAARRHVTVRCDENHTHTARAGCLTGERPYAEICKLCETLLIERTFIRKVVAKIGGE